MEDIVDKLDDALGRLSDELPQVPQSVFAQFADAIRDKAREDVLAHLEEQRQAELAARWRRR